MPEEHPRIPGPVIAIGGKEDRTGERVILRAFADALGGADFVLATIATTSPEEYIDTYRQAFADLPVGTLQPLRLRDRTEANDEAQLALLDGAGGIFFTGGDQLRISSQIGNTPLERRIRQLWQDGGVVAGTSAGASVVGEAMLVRGPGTTSYRIGDLHMAPGLGLLRDVIIDQHFAERGRFGRLLGAVAHNPRMLGIGLDEDTAVMIDGDRFRVLGSGAVYVLDAHEATQSNIADARAEETLSIFDVRLHVLSHEDGFELTERRPCEDGDGT